MNRLMLTLSLTGMTLITLAGCTQTPALLKNCRVVSGSGTWSGDFYVATVLLENTNVQEVDLEEVQFELVAYDGAARVVDRRNHVVLWTVRPLQRDRIRLDLFDQNRVVKKSHVILKDRRGRTISECFIHDTQPLGTQASDQPRRRQSHIESRKPSKFTPPST